MKDILSEYQNACNHDRFLAAAIVVLAIIVCLALYGLALSLEREAEIAQCESIAGAEWNGDACYYNGIKLNLADGDSVPDED